MLTTVGTTVLFFLPLKFTTRVEVIYEVISQQAEFGPLFLADQRH